MHLLLLLQEAFYNLIKNWLCLCKLSNAFQVTTLIFFFSTENLISNWSFQFVFLVPGNILDHKVKNSVIKIVLIFFLTSGPFPASFYDWFSSFQYNWYLTSKQRNVQYKFCRWLDSNRGPLVSEPTALPTEPQPLPKLYLFAFTIRSLLQNLHRDTVLENFLCLIKCKTTFNSVAGCISCQLALNRYLKRNS